MTQSVPAHNLFGNHTFGRDHLEPPPLPQDMQHGAAWTVAQMGATTAPAVQPGASSLPHDFDHLVRSIGEW